MPPSSIAVQYYCVSNAEKLANGDGMTTIIDPNYEIVTAQCEKCSTTCIFSRIDDLETVGPVSGERVTCFTCGAKFWINGDVVNTAYQFLIDDAKEQFTLKRYMPAIASLAQAWEVFFAEFAWSRYVYGPYFMSDRYAMGVDQRNDLSARLTTATKKFTFTRMRNLLVHTVAKNIHPQSVPEAALAIARIEPQGFGNDPPAALYEEVADPKTREALEQARDLTVGELRNYVIHKHAYRPRRSEVEPCIREEVKVLYRLKHCLNVRDFMEYQMDAPC
jgi:hypothetical protein